MSPSLHLPSVHVTTARNVELETRPVYVWTPEHAEAHFLTCYVAFVVLRILQKLCPGRPSARAILGELRKVECSADETNWWLFDYRSGLSAQGELNAREIL